MGGGGGLISEVGSFQGVALILVCGKLCVLERWAYFRELYV